MNINQQYIEREGRRRDAMVFVIALLAISVLVLVAAVSWLKGQKAVAMIDVSAATFLVLLLLVFRFSSYKQECRYVGVVLMYCLYLYLFLTGAAHGTTYMWHYTFPFFAIYLIGSTKGAAATILLFIPVFVKVVLDASSTEPVFYSYHFATRFIPSVSVALVFAYLFERERERFRRKSLEAYNEQERIIEERTVQLTERIAERDRIAEKLRQSQKMEAIGTMASGVAHDLNNILSGIVTYPELIRSDLPDDSPLQRPLQSMENAGKRAAAVVSDLLTLARNAASVKEVFDVHELIRDLRESPEWSDYISHHPNVRAVFELKADHAVMYGSQTHIRKCIMNLMINGFEAASPVGTVVISTDNSTGPDDGTENDTPKNEGGWLALSIRDDGPGVPPEHIQHIFEPFYTTKKMGKSGSGLGLSVVWNSVEEHQGTIRVHNTEPGADFVVTFPTMDSAIDRTSAKSSSDYGFFRGSGKVLVIDDEPQLRTITTDILEKMGYSVASVATGEDAVAYLSESEVDLVLLDMILGEGIGGFETYRRIIEIVPQQRAIIISGYSSSEEVQKTLALGAYAIIKKPYSMEELGRTVQACLESASPKKL